MVLFYKYFYQFSFYPTKIIVQKSLLNNHIKTQWNSEFPKHMHLHENNMVCSQSIFEDESNNLEDLFNSNNRKRNHDSSVTLSNKRHGRRCQLSVIQLFAEQIMGVYAKLHFEDFAWFRSHIQQPPVGKILLNFLEKGLVLLTVNLSLYAMT